MRHVASIAVLAVAAGLVGCSAQESHQPMLTSLDPFIEPAPPAEGSVQLGAGDALGQNIFEVYVAYLRLQGDQWPVYATGDVANERPEFSDF